MGKLTTEQILELITNEIQWCRENMGSPELSEQQHECQRWFILGLELARSTILEAEIVMEIGDEYDQ